MSTKKAAPPPSPPAGFDYDEETKKFVPLPSFDWKGYLNGTPKKKSPTKYVVPGVEIDPQTGKYVFTSYEMKDFLKFVGASPLNPPPRFGTSKQAYVPDRNYRKSTKGGPKKLFSQDQLPQPQLLMDEEVDEDIKTPDSVSSEESFLRMERLCKIPELQVESPMGTVRKLFDTKLTLNTQDENVPSQSVEIGQNDHSRIIAELKQVVQLDQQLCQEIAEKQALHAQNLATIKALTDQLAPGDVDKQENKENSVRRSRRLQTTSSPIPLPPRDLRKSVLTNNLVRTGQKSTVRDGSEQL